MIPASWIADSTSVQVDRGAGVQPDYGYFWWLPRILGRGSFLAIGNFTRAQGAKPPAQTDSVSPQQFMTLVRAVQATRRDDAC